MAVNAKSVFLAGSFSRGRARLGARGRGSFERRSYGLCLFERLLYFEACGVGVDEGAALEVARGSVTINLSVQMGRYQMAARAIDNIAATTGRTKEQAARLLRRCPLSGVW